uniref:REH2 DRSM domain-containing protein n=1 Tax=Trypanosoma brucei brucei (strain 927/4 GUTat10.1) TaxID=185431 RepID=Q4FKH6_TRYB2|nr:hypothetical protein Tb11.0320 [Trypanosoma brucei brucei TREU927]
MRQIHLSSNRRKITSVCRCDVFLRLNRFTIHDLGFHHAHRTVLSAPPMPTVGAATSTYTFPLLYCRRMCHTDATNLAAPAKTTALDAEKPQDVCVVESLDVFSKSRMLNYLSRHSMDDSKEDSASGRKASPFLITRVEDKTTFQVEMLVPAEAYVSGVLQRTALRAVGYAQREKDAIIAACMHAERCLDSLAIPLFTSERLQRKRVEEAKREGRYAPSPGDPVRELRLSELPFPLLYKCSAACKPTEMKGKFSVLRSYQPDYHTVKRRYEDFSRRSGGDPFLRGVAGELAYLQATIFKHNTSFPGAGEDEDDDHSSITIDPAEVELLRPSCVPRGQTSSSVPPNSLGCPAARLAVVNSRPLNEHRIAGLLDESEGGLFDMVEGEKDTWWIHEELPGMTCLYDPHAQKRVNEVYELHYNVPFASCVAAVASEELTQVDIGFGNNCRKVLTWFTVTAEIPGYPALQAKGKALSIDHATHLCAMHAELLLCCLGVPFSSNAMEQTRHYDACLRYGRLVSPVVREYSDELRALLPKPLKQWHRIKKSRKRGAPLSLAEKVVALNRRVVGDIRQHLVEVDICSEPQYTELLQLSISTLRQFMVEQQHPYESAYINFVYSDNKQYRCSIYLPLPEMYGIRGGVAIGATPESSRQLCALHAIDTLCALNVPITRDAKKLQRLLDERKRFGLILPQTCDSSISGLSHTVRSPPGYREAPGCATRRIPPHQDVWNLMMADAGDFDVVKDVEPEKCYKLGLPDTGTLLRGLFQTYLKSVGWATDGQWAAMRHYQGMQHWNGRLRLPCNNFWMELPVDESKYGRRVALGRCIFRKGAEKAFYIHALRILHALRIAPWDMHTDATLTKLLNNAPGIDVQRERSWWDFAVRELIEPVDTSVSKVGNRVTTVSEAQVVTPAGEGAEFDMIPSPNPVMTQELAKRTFV